MRLGSGLGLGGTVVRGPGERRQGRRGGIDQRSVAAFGYKRIPQRDRIGKEKRVRMPHES